MAALRVVEGGYQAAMLAPTEVLAKQHFTTLSTYFGNMHKRMKSEGMDIKHVPGDAGTHAHSYARPRVQLITGAVKGKARETMLQELRDGHIDGEIHLNYDSECFLILILILGHDIAVDWQYWVRFYLCTNYI